MTNKPALSNKISDTVIDTLQQTLVSCMMNQKCNIGI